ncbi:MAG TPA: stage II sporulation protein M [Beutenbergiaceae bacterium]|nr:stage II sporulation protein M [Beutenbergiaceae bacterium]
MDVDAFVALNAGRWARLRELLRRRQLSGAECDELISHYQATATHLSQLRTAAPDPGLVSRLSTMLARARGAISGGHELGWSDVVRFAAISLPAAFYRVRWWTLAAMVVFIAIGWAHATWLLATPEALAELGTPAERRSYAEDAFAAYYSNQPAPDFAAQVWTNNAWISAQAIGLGFTAVFPVYVLAVNAVGVGGAGAMMAEHGMLDVFFGLILPHGLMELTAIFIAVGTGTKLFWTWVAPGPRTRAQAMAEEGRALITIVLGLVVVLGVSGLVEGFVTPSDLPTGVKITIGALVLAGYWIYTIVWGRRAVRDGETGDMRAELVDDTVATAA